MPGHVRAAATASFIPLLITLAVYLIPVGGSDIIGNPNELSRILMTESIVVDGTFAVDGPIAVYGDSQDQSVREGRTYSDKAPGISYLGVPVDWLVRPLLPRAQGTAYAAYWPLRHVLVAFLVAAPAVLGLFALVLSAGGGPTAQRAWMAALLCVATPMLTYGITLFSHVPAALMVAGAWLLTARGRPTVARAGLAGVLAGFAVTTEYPTLLLGAVFGLVLICRRPIPLAAAAAYGAGVAAGILPTLLYHAAAFGSPFTTGYDFKVDPEHARIIASGASGVVWPSWERFHGVILSARRGLLFYCPMLVLAVAGIAARRRHAPREAWGVAAASAVYLLFGAAFVDWQGGWCAAARHLIPIVPLLAIAVVWSAEAAGERRWFPGALAALAGVSAAHQALSVMVTPLFPESFDRPLAQMAARSLLDGAAMPNLATDLTGVSRLAVAVAWGGLVLAVMAAALRRLPARGPRPSWLPGIAVAAAIAAAGIQMALSASITQQQEQGRAIVLDRLGYHELARRIAGAP
jgi:hypothetical protein